MKVTVVYKKSRLEREGRAPDPLIAQNWADSHQRQAHALATVQQELDKRGVDYTLVYRADLTGPLSGIDLVIVVGGDGTFIDASHAVEDTPMLGVNSDPVDSIGFFSTTTAETFVAVFDGWTKLPRHQLTRIETLIDGSPIRPLALNDVLVAHANPAATWRGRLELNGETQNLKNSGVLISTAAGSTAWSFQEGGHVLPIGSKDLQVILRGTKGAAPGTAPAVALHSLTRGAKLFIDGPHHIRDLAPGCHVLLQPGPPVTVLGDLPKKRKHFVGT